MNELDHIPMIFLAGPPGAGKTALGTKLCTELNLGFLDLSRPNLSQAIDAERQALEATIRDRSADVIALSWNLQQHAAIFTLTRRSGVVLLLWAHPLDMQARSGYSEPLFTPVKNLETRGGFGRTGSRCREFRRLDRACHETLMLVDVPLEKAAEDLKNYILWIGRQQSKPPAVREGLMTWAKDWQQDFGANRPAAEIIVDAMARYTLHLKSQGASPRKLSEVYDDLNSAGMLVMMYDAPKGKNAERILGRFAGPPWIFEFERKFSDSSSAIARYERNLEGFGRFLQQSGLFFRPMMSVITAAGEAAPGKVASSRGETVLARQLKKLHADKLQYRRALALQQLARDPDAAIIGLKFHYAWNTSGRRPLFADSTNYVGLFSEILVSASMPSVHA